MDAGSSKYVSNTDKSCSHERTTFGYFFSHASHAALSNVNGQSFLLKSAQQFRLSLTVVRLFLVGGIAPYIGAGRDYSRVLAAEGALDDYPSPGSRPYGGR